MAYVLLSAIKSDDQRIFRRYETTVASGTGDWIILDEIDKGDTFLCSIITTGGSGSVEFTTNSIAKVKADTASATTWGQGTVTEDTQACFPSGVTAVRFVNASGTVTGTITA